MLHPRRNVSAVTWSGDEIDRRRSWATSNGIEDSTPPCPSAPVLVLRLGTLGSTELVLEMVHPGGCRVRVVGYPNVASLKQVLQTLAERGARSKPGLRVARPYNRLPVRCLRRLTTDWKSVVPGIEALTECSGHNVRGTIIAGAGVLLWRVAFQRSVVGCFWCDAGGASLLLLVAASRRRRATARASG